MDIETTGSLYSLLRELKSSGVTILLVSHDVAVVATYIDTLVCLNRSMIAFGRPDDVAKSSNFTSMYGCDVAFLHHYHGSQPPQEDK